MAEGIVGLLALSTVAFVLGAGLIVFARRVAADIREIRGSTGRSRSAVIRVAGALLLIAGVAGVAVLFVR